ncbi:transferase [Aspergillus venezuelensis]
MCMHHNVVDATGFAEVLGIWARNTSIEGTIVDIHHHEYRQSRLSTALSAHLEPTHARSLDSLLDAHPEYSRSPPQLPQALPAYTTKLFGIPTSRLDEAKGLVSEYIPKPTTNTILSALVWLGITRARAQRVSQFNEDELITLISAVNSRRRVFGSESPYFGNMVLYALSKLPMNQMSSVINENEAPPELIAKLCTAISESQSSNRIDADHIAEVYSLVDRWDDPRTLFPGWDLFNSRNVTVTSWAGLDLYGVDFGRGLGKPEFVRIPASQADGVVILLPRRMVEARETVGSKDGSRELAEVMIMLREDDMKALEGDKFIAEFWNEAENISCRV